MPLLPPGVLRTFTTNLRRRTRGSLEWQRALAAAGTRRFYQQTELEAAGLDGKALRPVSAGMVLETVAPETLLLMLRIAHVVGLCEPELLVSRG